MSQEGKEERREERGKRKEEKKNGKINLFLPSLIWGCQIQCKRDEKAG